MCRWLLLGFVFLAFDASANRCLENWACWDVRKIDGQYQFWVRNLKPYVFTASIDVKATNLRSQKGIKSRFEETLVVPGNTEALMLTLEPVSSGRRVDYTDIFYWTPGDMGARASESEKYVAPFAAGENYPLVQGFGGGWSHRGASKYAVDFAMPIGTAVHAARSGVVVRVVEHHNRGGSDRRYAKYANYIVILHDDGTTGEYYHLKQNGSSVAVDEVIDAGQLIGYSGNTGFSSLPHLHFAVYRPQPMGDYESLPFKFADNVATQRNWWRW